MVARFVKTKIVDAGPLKRVGELRVLRQGIVCRSQLGSRRIVEGDNDVGKVALQLRYGMLQPRSVHQKRDTVAGRSLEPVHVQICIVIKAPVHCHSGLDSLRLPIRVIWLRFVDAFSSDH